MGLFLLFLFSLSLIIVANLATRMRDDRITKLFFTFLFLLNIPTFILGVLFVVLPEWRLQTFQPAENILNLNDPITYGIILQLTAVWGVLVTVGQTRHALLKNTRFRFQSPIHGLALLGVGYLVGNVALILSQGSLEQLAATAEPATLLDIITPGIAFTALGFMGVGLVVRRSYPETISRLGLTRPTRADLFLSFRWIFGLVILQGIVGVVWGAFFPAEAEQLTTVNERLLENVDTVWEWALLASSAGFGEEILFRGAFQPVLGVFFTAVIFALGHVQYGLTPITFLIFVLGLILGHLRKKHSTTVAIMVHTGYNFVLGLLALSVPYLEQFAEVMTIVMFSA
ncbi:MAG: CPBP family intramembrane glutamic endopeptidase [Chloroflexota bacterium]